MPENEDTYTNIHLPERGYLCPKKDEILKKIKICLRKCQEKDSLAISYASQLRSLSPLQYTLADELINKILSDAVLGNLRPNSKIVLSNMECKRRKKYTFHSKKHTLKENSSTLHDSTNSLKNTTSYQNQPSNNLKKTSPNQELCSQEFEQKPLLLLSSTVHHSSFQALEQISGTGSNISKDTSLSSSETSMETSNQELSPQEFEQKPLLLLSSTVHHSSFQASEQTSCRDSNISKDTSLSSSETAMETSNQELYSQEFEQKPLLLSSTLPHSSFQVSESTSCTGSDITKDISLSSSETPMETSNQELSPQEFEQKPILLSSTVHHSSFQVSEQTSCRGSNISKGTSLSFQEAPPIQTSGQNSPLFQKLLHTVEDSALSTQNIPIPPAFQNLKPSSHVFLNNFHNSPFLFQNTSFAKPTQISEQNSSILNVLPTQVPYLSPIQALEKNCVSSSLSVMDSVISSRSNQSSSAPVTLNYSANTIPQVQQLVNSINSNQSSSVPVTMLNNSTNTVSQVQQLVNSISSNQSSSAPVTTLNPSTSTIPQIQLMNDLSSIQSSTAPAVTLNHSINTIPMFLSIAPPTQLYFMPVTPSVSLNDFNAPKSLENSQLENQKKPSVQILSQVTKQNTNISSSSLEAPLINPVKTET